MKYNAYSLNGLSLKAREKLPEVLEANGYKDRYEFINRNAGTSLLINSTAPKVSVLFEKAENLAHGEEGHLITIKETAYTQVWIPASGAKSMKNAYKKAFEMVENGLAVDKDPEVAVACPADVPIYGAESYREDFFLEYIPDKN